MENKTEKQRGNSPDVKGGLWDSKHNLEQGSVFLWDDGTYKPHQTYNLQFSYKTGIQAVQVSQEIHSLSAMHKILWEQSQTGMEKMSLEILYLVVHSAVKFHKSDCFLLFAAGSLKVNPTDPEKMTFHKYAGTYQGSLTFIQEQLMDI